MDILSLGKASKALKQIKNLDEEIVGKKAESHFITVDERLDWIEAQAGKLHSDRTLQVDLSKGTFKDTELVDGNIQLKSSGLSALTYLPSGTYESPVIDLGEGWHKTKIIDVVKQINTGTTDCVTDICTSTDGITFSPYESLANQQARYVKIRATLSANPLPTEVNTYEFNQPAGNKVALNEYVLADGDLRLKTDYSYTSEDVFNESDGKIIKTRIPASLFNKINTLEVK